MDHLPLVFDLYFIDSLQILLRTATTDTIFIPKERCGWLVEINVNVLMFNSYRKKKISVISMLVALDYEDFSLRHYDVLRGANTVFNASGQVHHFDPNVPSMHFSLRL